MPESQIVFSTDPDFNKQKKSSNNSASHHSQDLRVHLDRRGGGKIVTIIRGFKGTSKQLLKLCSSLKKKFSIGGTVKDGTILLQGNIRDKLISYLINEGFSAKPSGG
tara:strand:- start:174 stop:494 length:321 start_codon:yes stop_codon:yes gene_type:complete